jgi:hypothetical protein
MFVATEAASSLGLYLSKSGHVPTLRRADGGGGVERADRGILADGRRLAKRFVLQLDPDVFRLVMDGIMLAAGLSMLWNAAHSN